MTKTTRHPRERQPDQKPSQTPIGEILERARERQRTVSYPQPGFRYTRASGEVVEVPQPKAEFPTSERPIDDARFFAGVVVGVLLSSVFWIGLIIFVK